MDQQTRISLAQLYSLLRQISVKDEDVLRMADAIRMLHGVLQREAATSMQSDEDVQHEI